MGRPTAFTEEIADEICARLSAGEPLAVICRDEGMPHRSTVYDWVAADEELSRRIACAREEGFDAIAAECLDIADDKSGDVRFVGDGEGEREVCNTEFVQRAKLRIETRLKLLAKWDPKRYGEKMALTGGAEDDAPIRTTATIDVSKLSPDQLKALASIKL